MLALKFKSPELASNWKLVVDRVQEEAVAPSPTKEPSSSTTTSKVEEVEPQAVTLADFAKSQKAGKWSCEACLTTNPDTKVLCCSSSCSSSSCSSYTLSCSSSPPPDPVRGLRGRQARL